MFPLPRRSNARVLDWIGADFVPFAFGWVASAALAEAVRGDGWAAVIFFALAGLCGWSAYSRFLDEHADVGKREG